VNLLVNQYGQPFEREPGARGMPGVAREPSPLLTGRFRTVAHAEAAVDWALQGYFQFPAWLCDQMLRIPRVRGPFQTRSAAHTGSEMDWLPGRDNRDGRRAVEAAKQDWPLIASPAARAQLSMWGQLLVGIAQKHWYVSPETGRLIPRLETWHPQFSTYNWALLNRRGAYRIWTVEGWETVPSPALTVPGETIRLETPDTLADPRRWVIHEPHGTNNFRHALIHALWASAMGWEFADRDMARLCERQGLAGLKLKYPRSTDEKTADGTIKPTSSLGMLMTALQQLGSKFVIPVEQYNAEDGLANYDVDPFEWSGVGWEIVNGTKESKALDLAILILGHNTTVQSSTAGASAGARVGNDVRDDIRVRDCLDEAATMHQQVWGDWAEVNFGDRGLAPIPIPRGPATMANVPAAQTLLTVGQAAAQLRALGVPDDAIEQILAGFHIPTGAGLGPMTAPPPSAPQAPHEPRTENPA
jgi:hypothetical protein